MFYETLRSNIMFINLVLLFIISLLCVLKLKVLLYTGIALFSLFIYALRIGQQGFIIVETIELIHQCFLTLILLLFFHVICSMIKER